MDRDIVTSGSMMSTSVYSCIERILGEAGARALGYYVDYSLVEKDPTEFECLLAEVFARGASVIERMIVEDLYATSGLGGVPAPMLDFPAEISKYTALKASPAKCGLVCPARH